ncbi:hypothetical protein Rsub_11401 [Raphidocelis subcapitata]|uniref:Uncharacterized protein n=1 Tax=Raphidocelis subcapitata TaxID=307507 RepID=A0A2V0PMT0_9CHLO|nr:hypothetical protein Rsub_11401 [Raphidocelis subcapitata]|eukprot:GBF98687.1 hypothetical protein Rsub_11401 [Raphidocelis subcapitata]
MDPQEPALAPSLIANVVILRSTGRGAEEDALAARLERGGVRAATAERAGELPALAQEWGVRLEEVAVLAPESEAAAGGPLQGAAVLHWPQGSDGTAAIQALAQLNLRRAARASAHVGGSSGADGAAATPRTFLLVGYAMKPSREAALAGQGLLPLLPRRPRAGPAVAFVPLDLGRPLGEQPPLDVLLHKGSDELVAGAGGRGGAPAWSEALLRLQRELAQRPQVAVVDPFECTAKVVDRCLLAEVLSGLEQLPLPGGVRARAPRHVVASLGAPDLQHRLDAAGLSSCALLVKPIVACGLPESHSMALVLQPKALRALRGGLLDCRGGSGGSGGGGGVDSGGEGAETAVVQEFVNHGGLQYKAYVIADKVFYATRASIPDVARPPAPGPDADAALLERQVLRFDSLASLPTRLPAHMAAPPKDGAAARPPQPLPRPALEAVAAHLRRALGLTLFGFDVVVCSDTGDWLVVDVNYFPNYKGGPPETAAWLAEAMAEAHARRQHRE